MEKVRVSLLLPSPSSSPPIFPVVTMSNVANEKGSISESHGICDEHHTNGGNGAPTLSTHTYVHNTAPQLRVIANPGPL